MTTTTEITDRALERVLVRHTTRIGGWAFHRALMAALPHVGDEKVSTIHRVRLTFAGGNLEAEATNQFTLIIIRQDGLPELDENERETWTVDLHPEDAAMLTKLFKPKGDTEMTLRLDLGRDDRLRVTEADGLFDGRAYTVPTMAGGTEFPRTRDLILNTMGLDREVVGTVTYTGELLRAWAASSQVLFDRLNFQPTRANKPFLVTIGSQAIGLLQPARVDDENTAHQREVQDEWHDVLRGGQLR